jgi:hypothetical protein
MGQFFRSFDNAPLEFRIQHFQLPRLPVKLSEDQGIASELLRRSALGLENGRVSAQPGIRKTVSALAFSWIFFRRRPARLFSRNFDRPKNFVFSPLKPQREPRRRLCRR